MPPGAVLPLKGDPLVLCQGLESGHLGCQQRRRPRVSHCLTRILSFLIRQMGMIIIIANMK